jgi:hypothetical protein
MLLMMSNDIHNTKAEQIATPHNLLNNYHQVHYLQWINNCWFMVDLQVSGKLHVTTKCILIQMLVSPTTCGSIGISPRRVGLLACLIVVLNTSTVTLDFMIKIKTR